MKTVINLILLAAVAISFSTTAVAKSKSNKKMMNTWDRPYGLAGCGLGSIVMGKEGNQVLAATTNNIHGLETQIFGIIFGTSNCVDSNTHKMAKNIDVFVHTNKVSLASDMARGNGETLASLGSMLGCNDSNAFGALMKSEFFNIYTSEKVQAFEITDSVINTLLKDKNMSKSCSNLNLG